MDSGVSSEWVYHVCVSSIVYVGILYLCEYCVCGCILFVMYCLWFYGFHGVIVPLGLLCPCIILVWTCPISMSVSYIWVYQFCISVSYMTVSGLSEQIMNI